MKIGRYIYNRSIIHLSRSIILISEILHQGGILNTLKEVNIFIDAQIGTVTGKVINGSTLKHNEVNQERGLH